AKPIHHISDNRRHERTAAEGRPMISRLHCRPNLLGDQHSAHWQSASERLCQGQNVRGNAKPFVREQVPCTAEAALNLIEYQSDLALCRDLPELAHEVNIEHPDSTFALNRLENQRRHSLSVQRRVQLGEISLTD